VIRVGNKGIISPLEPCWRRWMRRAACYNSMIVPTLIAGKRKDMVILRFEVFKGRI